MADHTYMLPLVNGRPVLMLPTHMPNKALLMYADEYNEFLHWAGPPYMRLVIPQLRAKSPGTPEGLCYWRRVERRDAQPVLCLSPRDVERGVFEPFAKATAHMPK